MLVFKLLDPDPNPKPNPKPNPNPNPNPNPSQVFKLLDEGAAFYALHMVSNPMSLSLSLSLTL